LAFKDDATKRIAGRRLRDWRRTPEAGGKWGKEKLTELRILVQQAASAKLSCKLRLFSRRLLQNSAANFGPKPHNIAG
jgi:hypothetical protein